MSVGPVLSLTVDAFPNFKLKTEISTVFLECQQQILLLQRGKKEDQSHTWGVPGGKKEGKETPIQTLLRELDEETKLKPKEDEVTYCGHRYARIPGWDYKVHIYHMTLDQKPSVTLDDNEHNKFEWVSMYAFKTMPLLKGQGEVFDIVYGDRLWQAVTITGNLESTLPPSLVLRKGDQELRFDSRRRFVLNLIGTSGSGKGTQGDLLSKIFEIPNISAGDLFRDEFRAESALGWMVTTYDEHHYPKYLPDEVPIGMIAQRLAGEDCVKGFILDGFPRTESQGVTTREVFLRPDDFHVPLFMDVPEQDIWDRLPGRSICSECGHQVRKFDENPWPGFCPIEAKQGKMIKLEKREEDVDKSKIERRLSMFRENKAAILETMGARDPVKTFSLDNTIPPREVLHLLCEEIQTRLDAFASKVLSSETVADSLRVDGVAAGVLGCKN